MRIAVFGLGYVGSVSAACLAAAGHTITGVDVDQHKLSLIASGRSPVSEPGLDDLLGEMVRCGRVRVTDAAAAAISDSELSLICVGTPSRRNGGLDATFLERVFEQIGAGLRGTTTYHVVAVRSTVLPGYLQARLIPLLEATSGLKVGTGVGVCVNPEFLREGSAIRDFERPPMTLIGQLDERAGDVIRDLYAHIKAPLYRLRPDEASMVKYASNGFHALKVAFANEIGALSQQLGVDGRSVMQVFCEDRDLNISPRYLQPGFGFGGSCLPKDLRAATYLARQLDVATPVLDSILPSNDAHIQRVVDNILDRRPQAVALLGLSFKSGSDDLRESPFVRLAESLIGKGVPLRIFDPDVTLTNVFGVNQRYIHERLPHIGQLLTSDLGDAVSGADVVIVGKRLPGVLELQQRLTDQTVIDLVGIPELGVALRPWSGSEGRSAVVGAVGL